jgi:hypothetical protein
MTVRTAFDHLARAWESQSAPIADWIAPGLAPDVISAALASEGLTPSTELCDYFQWHNGTRADAPIQASWMGPGRPDYYELYSLPSCLLAYQMLRGVAVDVSPGDPDWLWPRDWFPITGNSDYLAVDLSDPSAPNSPVHFKMRDQPAKDAERVADSLTALLDAWSEALNQGIVSWNSAAGDWERDEERADLLPRGQV